MKAGIWAALWLVAAACEGSGSVVFVTVDARPSVREVDELRVTAQSGEASASQAFPLGDRSFPVTFTVTPSGRSGDIEIAAEAVSEEGLVRGLGSAGGTIVQGGRLPLEMTLEPADFVVNSELSGSQRPTFRASSNGRQLAVTSDDSFLVSFVNDCATLGRCDIFGRLFGSEGAPAENDTSMDAGDFIANLEEEFSSVPAVAAGGDVIFVAWETFEDVRGVALTATGGHVSGSDTVLSAADAMLPSDPAVAALDGGEFVIVWSQERASGGKEIRGRLVDATGAPITNPVTGDDLDFAVSASAGQTFENPTVAASGNGREFVAVWESESNVVARFFDPSGMPQTMGDAQLTAFEPGSTVVGPRIAYTADGNAAVAFAAHASGELASGGFVFGRFEKPLGAMLGGLQTLATPAPDELAAPALAARSDGTFGVAWHQCGEAGDGSGCGVYLQTMTAEGELEGEPRVVNTTTGGDQSAPSIAPTSYGFVLVWSDESESPPDTEDGAVRGRLIYTAPSTQAD